MKRLGRYTLNTLTGVSLLLCVAATALWVRGRGTTDVVSHRGEYLWQAVAGRGTVFVQRVGYVARTAEGGPELAPAVVRRPGAPGVPRPALTDYVETPGSYADWVAPRVGSRPMRPMLAMWRWAAEQSPGWRWNVETDQAPAATRPRAVAGVQAWLVDGRPAITAAAASQWPGSCRAAQRVGGMTSVRYDRATGAQRATAREDWLMGRTTWVPLWLVVAATAALPLGRTSAGSVRRLKARRRARAGRCPRCGYDLRATPDQCPECGTSASVTPSP